MAIYITWRGETNGFNIFTRTYTFHDQVKHPGVEAQHHVETRHIRPLDLLEPLRRGLNSSVTGNQGQQIVLKKKILVFAAERVKDVPVRRSESENFWAVHVLPR